MRRYDPIPIREDLMNMHKESLLGLTADQLVN